MKARDMFTYLAYVFAFFASLYLFTLLTIPKAEIARYVSEKLFKVNGIDISYKGSDISLGMNLIFKEVELEFKDDLPKLYFTVLKLGLSPFQYLFGSRPFVIIAEGYGGDIKVAGGMKKENIGLAISSHNLDLSLIDVLKEKTGLNLKGGINLDLKIDMNKKESKITNGNILLSMGSVEVKGGKVLGFEIPAINIGDIKGEIDIKEGKLKIENFKGKGKDIEIKATGDGTILQPLNKSNINLNLKLKPSQQFVERDEKVKTLLFGIGSSLDKDGFYNFSIKGPLSNPTFLPDRKN